MRGLGLAGLGTRCVMYWRRVARRLTGRAGGNGRMCVARRLVRTMAGRSTDGWAFWSGRWRSGGVDEDHCPSGCGGGCGLRTAATAARFSRKAGALGLVMPHRRVAAGPERMPVLCSGSRAGDARALHLDGRTAASPHLSMARPALRGSGIRRDSTLSRNLKPSTNGARRWRRLRAHSRCRHPPSRALLRVIKHLPTEPLI